MRLREKLDALCERLEQARNGDLSHLPEDAEHMAAQDLHFAGVFLDFQKPRKAASLMARAMNLMGWAER